MRFKIEVISEENMERAEDLGIDSDSFSEVVDIHIKNSSINAVYAHEDKLVVESNGIVYACIYDSAMHEEAINIIEGTDG